MKHRNKSVLLICFSTLTAVFLCAFKGIVPGEWMERDLGFFITMPYADVDPGFSIYSEEKESIIQTIPVPHDEFEDGGFVYVPILPTDENRQDGIINMIPIS